MEKKTYFSYFEKLLDSLVDSIKLEEPSVGWIPIRDCY